MIAFENASAGYGGRVALRSVSTVFSPGAVTGIVGPNGAGKTTLLRTALNLLPLQSGKVLVQGRSVAEWSREAESRSAMPINISGAAKARSVSVRSLSEPIIHSTISAIA